jgi:transposase
METGYMPLSSEETIHLLLKMNKEQEETIQDLRTTVKELRATIANLNETLEELKRKLFGASSERTCAQSDINDIVNIS